jgi:hypothetical protein
VLSTPTAHERATWNTERGRRPVELAGILGDALGAGAGGLSDDRLVSFEAHLP